jgi:hypothetical protein
MHRYKKWHVCVCVIAIPSHNYCNLRTPLSGGSDLPRFACFFLNMNRLAGNIRVIGFP